MRDVSVPERKVCRATCPGMVRELLEGCIDSPHPYKQTSGNARSRGSRTCGAALVLQDTHM